MDDLPVYPGTGYSRRWFTEHVSRISINSYFSEPVSYMVCEESYLGFDRDFAKYFLDHPKLKWIHSSTKNVANVPGKIIVFTDNGNEFVGRTTLTSKQGKTYQQIGYIKHDLLHFWHESYENSTNFEVLVCEE